MPTFKAIGIFLFGVLFFGTDAKADSTLAGALVPTGRLRVALLVSNPALVTRDSSSIDIRGVAPDIARSLADRLRVSFQPIRFTSASQILNGAASDIWDVTFLTIDPERAKSVDFTPPYMGVENCLLVPIHSSLTSINSIDNPGIRIAVIADSSNSLSFARKIKAAQLVRVQSNDTMIEVLRNGQADVFADNRPLSQRLAERVPGARVLDCRHNVGLYAMAIPKGNMAALQFLSEFLDREKRSGAIADIVTHAGSPGVVLY